MRLLYSGFIFLYSALIQFASLFNHKAKLWINGRKNINYLKIKSTIDSQKKRSVWIHCSSLGEFEQGRPIIEKLKETNEYFIVLTFFSPSGFEIRKEYNHADLILYMPNDTPSNVKIFLESIKPSFAIFVKYDFWFNYIYQLKQRNIPIYYISTIFRPSQHFFSWWGFWFKKHLKMVSHFFVQNQESQTLLASIHINQVSIVGDTRFDRVSQILSTRPQIPKMDLYTKNRNLFIAGSTWSVDYIGIKELINKANTDWCFLIAPHEIHEDEIENLLNSIALPDHQKTTYSKLTVENASQIRVVVVDGIGYLSSLYAYGKIAYIGGGFGKGLHNILEAAVFGVPIIIGPNHQKFQEAVELTKRGGALVARQPLDIEKQAIELMHNPERIENASFICEKFVSDNLGATNKIIDMITQK